MVRVLGLYMFTDGPVGISILDSFGVDVSGVGETLGGRIDCCFSSLVSFFTSAFASSLLSSLLSSTPSSLSGISLTSFSNLASSFTSDSESG